MKVRAAWHTAFTLVELAGVLVILAILATAASVALHGTRRRAELAEAAGQVAFADSACRQTARTGDTVGTLTFVAGGGRIYRTTGGGRSPLADLPAGVVVGRVRIGSDTIDFGDAVVPVSVAGVTPTYAVRLDAGPAGHEWVVFAGVSGQANKVTDAQAETILDAVRADGGGP